MKTLEIAEFLSGQLVGSKDVDITAVASLESAKSNEISFFDKPRFPREVPETNAGCIIVAENFETETLMPVIKVKSPKLAFAKIAQLLHPPKARVPEIHNSAEITSSAKLGRDIFVGAFCFIGENSEIGDATQILAGSKIGENVTIGTNCVLHPNVTVEDNCFIGSDVILHSGAVIGADGFGFVRDSDGYVKFPQIGTVIIEDNVEIGANSCIDRGALGETRIGAGTKIDNLVQIAHNVQIGKRVVIAAQTGISGSTVIEDDCVIGGQVGMGDHATIKSGAVIGSQAGVLPGKIVRKGVWWGTPVQPLDDYKIQNALVRGLARMRSDIKEIKKKIN